MGKQNIHIDVKYATCITSGLKIATKISFSDDPHSGLSIAPRLDHLKRI
jgi:hypothetical protein